MISAKPLLAVLALLLSSGGAVAAQPTYSYANAIRQTAWVDTGMPGVRVAADIIRPVTQGRKVPVIMEASPYFSCCGRGNQSQKKTYDAHGDPVQFPEFFDNYFVPRGYAVVLVDLAGTGRSQGCVDLGGPSDVRSATAVINWLNGRARGYSSPTSAVPMVANWSTGAVGMVGKSYDATIAEAVAATGVPGLRTIVPVEAISSWYDYYFSDGATYVGDSPATLVNGVETANGGQNCSAATAAVASGSDTGGDVTAFWAQRDYLRTGSRATASEFVVAGLQDANVKTNNFGQWWNMLSANDVPRKLWLSQTGHVDPFDFRRADWVSTLQQWFDYWLMGSHNGVMNQPMVSVERNPDRWVDEPTWPPADTHQTALFPTANGLGSIPAAPWSSASFTDDPGQNEFAWAAPGPTAQAGDRLLFSTGPLAHDLRVAGTGSITVTVTPSTPTADLSAVLVDYGPQTIRNYLDPFSGITNLNTQSCWGEGDPGDTGCFYDTEADTMTTDWNVFSRGWADLANHTSLASKAPLVPGRPYTITFPLDTTDHV
ncbi:MAG TPA: CocE/NonD family hydrolase, partial [Pseudonocardiaceae bacterium]